MTSSSSRIGPSRGLNERTPQCRTFGSASAMREAVEKVKTAPAIEASNIHHAKGKEWRHVFIIGATDGVLPDYRSTSPARLVDERKVMFVAATRASETLTLVHAPHVLQPRHSPTVNAQRAQPIPPHPRGSRLPVGHPVTWKVSIRLDYVRPLHPALGGFHRSGLGEGVAAGPVVDERPASSVGPSSMTLVYAR
jgi:hypothetical protein